MEVPVKNIVEQVDLSHEDVLLPLLECIVNSIISLQQSELQKEEKKIQIQIFRNVLPQNATFEIIKTISSFKIIDNGIGFNEKNFESFKTPFSQINQDYGCKGVGRFTVLAAFEQFHVKSNYEERGKWYSRNFSFTVKNEINETEFKESGIEQYKTVVHLDNCNNQVVLEKSAMPLEIISAKIMDHCLIYYLNKKLPLIEIWDKEYDQFTSINELFKKVSKDKERVFSIGSRNFRLYITKTIKEGNRKNNYLHYCANSRTVGDGRNLKYVNNIFNHPILLNGKNYFFDIYLVSNYLNQNVYKTRNGFKIPKEKENLLFNDVNILTLQDIEEKISEVMEEEYAPYVKEAKERSIQKVRSYIREKAPRYNSFLKNQDVLKSIPPNLSEDKLEEHLYSISYSARKNVEHNISQFIHSKSVNEEAIKNIINDIKEKTSYDVDSLADYMMRRRAIIDLFDKFLDADENNHYKLEEDIHNLIFPMGFTNKELDFENHNLWLLDERFITYKFIASDKPITSYSQLKSRKEADLMMMDIPQMFNNPISFGDRSSGEVNSMVIFEFKRPGEIAHQKRKTDYRWEFSDLIEPYFEDFLYSPVKKNYKGNQVIIRETTPKFGFVILDIIPEALAKYNTNKGWKTTPFGTFFKIQPGTNMHIEVMTFRKLLEFSRNRHNPFFDKLFVY